MIFSSSSPPIRRRPGEGRGPRGFTMVELMAVVLILAILIALLLPALNLSLNTARNAAVGGEIDQLAQALASFKAQYGDYPPSRIYLAENGDFGSAAFTPIAPGDITYAQLAQRSVAALRKFFPRVVL
ncbi:MAG: prepilin-type N-terminal cleavage/methylation domain-containing protein, partial [Isosphaeraceae bacterium]